MKKKCKCGSEFEPYRAKNSTIDSKYCFACLIKKGAKIRKKEIKEKHKMLKTKVRNEKPILEKRLEREMNAICRLIDKGCSCISCTYPGNSAGHRHSVGSNPSIRYNLHNLHLQENSCNGEKGGNPTKYDQGLERVYGAEYKEYVVFEIVRLYSSIHLSQEELKEAIAKARKVRKELIDKNGTYDSTTRIALRELINNQIGIYK